MSHKIENTGNETEKQESTANSEVENINGILERTSTDLSLEKKISNLEDNLR